MREMTKHDRGFIYRLLLLIASMGNISIVAPLLGLDDPLFFVVMFVVLIMSAVSLWRHAWVHYVESIYIVEQIDQDGKACTSAKVERV